MPRLSNNIGSSRQLEGMNRRSARAPRSAKSVRPIAATVAKYARMSGMFSGRCAWQRKRRAAVEQEVQDFIDAKDDPALASAIAVAQEKEREAVQQQIAQLEIADRTHDETIEAASELADEVRVTEDGIIEVKSKGPVE
jgi:hypothetical protein